MLPDDYLTTTESTLSQADHFGDLEKPRLLVAEAVAAAIDRLAVAVEAMADR
jgi:hypothetical protein